MSDDGMDKLQRREIQDLLLNSEDITTFLHEFTTLLADEIAEGETPIWCAVSLLRDKKASTAAASSPEAEALDELQNSFTDGPCMTAIRDHAMIRVGDVRHDTRWPDYLPAAKEQGVRSILGIPFELQEEAHAGVNIYSPTPNDFDTDKIALSAFRRRSAGPRAPCASRSAWPRTARPNSTSTPQWARTR